MKIIHNLGVLNISKATDENAGFLLSNRRGSYCSFSNAASRYQGMFYLDAKSMEMYKFIESIEIEGKNDVDSLKNAFYYAERIKKGIVENFMMPRSFNSLVYELSESNEVDLILDCKKSFDNREWGRNYEIFKEGNCIIVKFTKKTDSREDSTSGKNEFVLFLAIKSDSGRHEAANEWFERH